MLNMNAYLDDFGKMTITMNRNFYGGKSDYFYLCAQNGYCKELIIKGVQELENEVRYEIAAPAGLRFGCAYSVREQHGLETPLVFRRFSLRQIASRT